MLMRFHTQTAGVSLTGQQPHVNIVRTAIEALAAVLGGTQSLHTNSFDEALALPTEEAVRIALRTQQVIAHETGVVNTIDPLGGSYYVEALTNRLEAEAYEFFGRIDELGGMVAAIEQNIPQREIAEAAYRYQREVEAEERIVVGVNRYRSTTRSVNILRIDPELERKQIERLQAFKARRDSALVERRSPSSPRPPRSRRNLMPLIVDAVRDDVTLGEICDAWRQAWGTWREQPVSSSRSGIRLRGFRRLDPRLRRGTSLKASASPPQTPEASGSTSVGRRACVQPTARSRPPCRRRRGRGRRGGRARRGRCVTGGAERPTAR